MYNVAMKIPIACAVLLSCGCAQLTESEQFLKEYEAADRYNIRLERFHKLENSCPYISILNPSRQYLRTGVPTKEDLMRVSCGLPALMY